jgi:hypothetical protein
MTRWQWRWIRIFHPFEARKIRKLFRVEQEVSDSFLLRELCGEDVDWGREWTAERDRRMGWAPCRYSGDKNCHAPCCDLGGYLM